MIYHNFVLNRDIRAVNGVSLVIYRCKKNGCTVALSGLKIMLKVDRGKERGSWESV